jgi:hypothetical protein
MRVVDRAEKEVQVPFQSFAMIVVVWKFERYP